MLSGCPKTSVRPQEQRYPVTFAVDGTHGTLEAKIGSTVLKNKDSAPLGATVVFTAKPEAGYKVKAWTLDGNPVNGTAETYPLKITKVVTVTVSFESSAPVPPPPPPAPRPTPKFKVTFSVDGGNGILTAKLDGKEITTGTEVEKDKTVTFTANPAAANILVNTWTVSPSAALIEGGAKGNTAAKVKITAETTVTVRFEAVPDGSAVYRVEHYKQNVTGADYTKAEEESTTGKPNAQTQAQAKAYEGFNAKLPITQSAIKADGSTVIKVYYDRKTITLTLNLDGGSTSTPLTGGKLTGRFGAAVNVAAPTKPGYTFKGWNPALPAAFPSENPAETYTAQWEVLSYAVTFSVEGNPENGTLSAELDGNLITSPAQVEKDKTVTFTAKPANANVLVKKWTVTPPSALTEGGTDGSLTAKVKITAATTVSLSFDAPPPGFALYKVEHWKQNVAGTDYEKAETEITTGSAGAQTEAQAKTYPGFTLKDSVTQVPIAGEGTTVVKIEYDRKEISLSLNLDGGSTSTPLTGGKLTGRFGTAVTIAEPTRPDHIFDGWNPALPPTFPAEDPAETYTAKWKVLYELKFSVEGDPANGTLSAELDGTPITSSPYKVQEGKTIVFTATPANANVLVKKWTITPPSALTEGGADGSLTAKVKITAATTVSLSFDAPPPGSAVYRIEHWKQNIAGTDYEKAETETKTGAAGAQTEAQAKTYPGFTLKGAVTQTAIAGEGTTVVKIEYDRKEISLSLNLDGGSTSTPLTGGKLTGRFGTAVNIVEPTRPDHIFKGWNPRLPETFPPEDPAETYSAQWAALHKITFGVDGTPPRGSISAVYQKDNSVFNTDTAVLENTVLIFTAAPDPQFAVEQWTVDGTPVPGNTANTYAHTVTAQAEIKVKFKYTGPDLLLDTSPYNNEQEQSFSYKLVTSGSGNYTAEPETQGFFTLNTDALNSSGTITVHCEAEGAGVSRIKVTDNLSGQTAFSGLITLIPDYITVDGLQYKVTDKKQRHVQITGKEGGYFTGTVHIPATAAFAGETYQITGFTDDCLERGLWNVSALTVDGANAFLSAENGVLFNKDKTRLIKYPKLKTDASYTVPDSVQTIGKYAFYKIYDNLTALTLPEGKALSVIEDNGIESCPQLEQINLPSSLTSLGDAFLFSSQVTSVVIPEGIERLGHASLAFCPKLTKVELPASFKYFTYNGSIYSCGALTEVVCKAATPPIFQGEASFSGTPIDRCTLKVPQGSVDLYKAAPVWQNFGTIVEITP